MHRGHVLNSLQMQPNLLYFLHEIIKSQHLKTGNEYRSHVTPSLHTVDKNTSIKIFCDFPKITKPVSL